MRNLILGLARPMLRQMGRDDRGAIGILIGVLIGGGVLLGMGALAIDVGQLYQNRADLQNAADAGALAVAESCATTTGCTPSVATKYAADNSNVKTVPNTVNLVCGTGGGLGSCPASNGQITDCPTAPSAGTNYVDVHTSTQTSGGSSLLPPSFARALSGNGNYQGSTVLACARAEWGAPAVLNTVAMTISACEWDAATQQGTSFAPAPPYPPNPLPDPSFDQVIKLHTTDLTGCSTEPAGADGPGAFGWTTDQTGSCGVDVTGGTYGVNTGVSAGKSCQDALASAQANRTLVFIPVYVAINGTGSTATYTLKGFAAFVVTGYHLPGFTASDWLNPSNDCKGSDKCVNGYFTRGLIPGAGAIGGTNLGATIVTLAG